MIVYFVYLFIIIHRILSKHILNRLVTFFDLFKNKHNYLVDMYWKIVNPKNFITIKDLFSKSR